MQTLMLLRHAKSDWNQPDLSDQQRPLNRRGQHEAQQLSRWLTQQAQLPTGVLCSSATRTRETWQWLAPAFKQTPQVEFLDSLYACSSTVLLRHIEQYLPQHSSLLLIGHNPELEELLQQLCPQQTLPRTDKGKLLTTANLAILQRTQPQQAWQFRQLIRAKELVTPSLQT